MYKFDNGQISLGKEVSSKIYSDIFHNPNKLYPTKGDARQLHSFDGKVDNPVPLYTATKRAMSCWLMHTPSSIIFYQRDCVSSRFMVSPSALKWHTLALLTS